MGSVTVRNLDDETIDRLKERARRNGRSLEGELRMILSNAAAAASLSGITPEAARAAIKWAPRAGQPARPFKAVKVRGESPSERLIRERR